MQWIDNCPECLAHYIRVVYAYLSRRINPKDKRYQGLNELEEQQFKFSLKEQSKMFEDEHKVQERQKKKNSFIDKTHIQIEGKLIDNLPIERTGNSKYQEEKTNSQQQYYLSQNVEQNEKFKINIDPFSPYYALIDQRVKTQKQINNLLDNKGEELDIGLSIANFNIYDTKSQTKLKYVITYNLPCSYSFYSSLNNNKIAKDLTLLMEDHILLETVQSNLKIYYLGLGKFMMLSSREFTYLKYHYGHNNENWEVCVSIQPKQTLDKGIKEKQRIPGEFFSVTHIEQIHNRKGINIEIRSYLQLDLKSVIKNQKVIHRGLSEVKNYIDRLYQYCQQTFQEQLV